MIFFLVFIKAAGPLCTAFVRLLIDYCKKMSTKFGFYFGNFLSDPNSRLSNFRNFLVNHTWLSYHCFGLRSALRDSLRPPLWLSSPEGYLRKFTKSHQRFVDLNDNPVDKNLILYKMSCAKSTCVTKFLILGFLSGKALSTLFG